MTDIALLVSAALFTFILAGAPCEFPNFLVAGANEKGPRGAVLFGNFASISILLNGENSQADLPEILYVWNEGFAGRFGVKGVDRDKRGLG